jgi:hypothetical protein
MGDMIELRRAEENEVVLAFLQAEIDSPRWAKWILGALAENGVGRGELIDHPDLGNQTANAMRRALLGRFRGFGVNTYLFAEFPYDVQWTWVQISQAEQSILKYANCSPWIQLSGGTRLVTEGAKNLSGLSADQDPRRHIEAIAEAVKQGRRFPALVAVKSDDGFLILLEGHCRATAYVAAGFKGGIDLIVGSSRGISKWVFY